MTSNITEQITTIFQQAEASYRYNDQLNYERTVRKNERFLNGDQWKGVNAGDLPTPQANIFKKTFAWIIAWLTSSRIVIKYSVMGVDMADTVDEDKKIELEAIKKALFLLNKKIEQHMEFNDFDHIIAEILKDGVISGDMSVFVPWDERTPNLSGTDDTKIKGDFVSKRIRGAKVLLGDPNTNKINDKGYPVQPYIILPGRALVSELREEYKATLKAKGGLTDEEINLKLQMIQSDTNQGERVSADRQQYELDTTLDPNVGKTDYYIRLRYDKEKGKIMKQKATRTVDITEETDTKLTIYPLAWENWDTRDESYHGQAPMTGYIPNQVFINKSLAIIMIAMMNNASPKIAYDQTKVNGVSNSASGAIKVNGEVTNAIKVISVGGVSNNIMSVIEYVSKNMVESLGGNETVLGNVNPVNKSAIVQVTEQSSIPFENQRKAIYRLSQQLAYIYLEYIKQYYGKTNIEVTYEDDEGVQRSETFNMKVLMDKIIVPKVDVGESSYFSENNAIQLLGGLVEAGLIDVIDYIKRMPDGTIPQQKELVEELEQRAQGVRDAQQEEDWEKVASFVETLPKEYQQQFAKILQAPLNPEV